MNFYWLHYRAEVLFWSTINEEPGYAEGMAFADCLHYQKKWERCRERERWASVNFRVDRETYQDWQREAAEAGEEFEAYLVNMIQRGRSVYRRRREPRGLAAVFR